MLDTGTGGHVGGPTVEVGRRRRSTLGSFLRLLWPSPRMWRAERMLKTPANSQPLKSFMSPQSRVLTGADREGGSYHSNVSSSSTYSDVNIEKT